MTTIEPVGQNSENDLGTEINNVIDVTITEVVAYEESILENWGRREESMIRVTAINKASCTDTQANMWEEVELSFRRTRAKLRQM